MRDEVEAFIGRHWHGNAGRWFNALGSKPWPDESWRRDEQLIYLSLLAEHNCPLPPEGVSVIEPVIKAVGTIDQQQIFLPLIRELPLAGEFVPEYRLEPSGTGWSVTLNPVTKYCLVLTPDSTLYCLQTDELTAENGTVIFTPAAGNRIGECQQGLHYLSQSQSCLTLLQQLKSSLRTIESMNNHWQDAFNEEASTLSVEITSLEGMYLGGTENDALIMLRANELLTDCYYLLFQTLGYYALIDPDPLLSDNEPLPFAAERSVLQYLKQTDIRNTMIQRDKVYENLESE
jgi:hypothetical protein